MKICLLEPFHTGSHATWAEEYARFSRHEIELLTLEGRHWKWRMHGGATTLARQFLASSADPDLLLSTDMLDLTTFLALTRKRTASIPTAIYFHENQLTYPWSPADSDPAHQRDAHYAFINYSSATAADAVLFNSNYHQESFYAKLPDFLKSFPDHNELASIETLKKKSFYLPLALDLKTLDSYRLDGPGSGSKTPLILWNHRWEYDKNPVEFFQALFCMAEEGYDFNVAILGESYQKTPAIFAEAKQKLGKRIQHHGYANVFSDYVRWLWRADILPVTSRHDFFGASVVQAIYCNCMPLLPDRLAYPEHLPASAYQQHLYQSYEDFLGKLRLMLQGGDHCHSPLREHVFRYDWTEQVNRYDDLFELLAQ